MLCASTSISLTAKKTVYESLILSILLYGTEHWCLTEVTTAKNVYIRCLCQHTCLHRIRTTDLLERFPLLPIDVYVNRRQLRWLGHVARMDSKRLPRKMLTSWVEFTYGRSIYKCFKRIGISKNDWYEKARNRDEWRNIIGNYLH